VGLTWRRRRTRAKQRCFADFRAARAAGLHVRTPAHVPMLAQIVALFLALGLGVVLAVSFYAQVRLQRQARSGDPTASPFRRIVVAGISLAILVAAVLIGKQTSLSYEVFMLVVFVSALAAFYVRWRSNSTPHTDARDQPEPASSLGARAGERER